MDKSSLKIMIVNRSQMLRAIIRDSLKKNGFVHITSSENAETGLRMARSSPPDLMIVDFGLPDMTGLELLNRVRHDPNLQDTAFILISSEPERMKVAAAAERRVNAYVVKPFSQQTLLDKINQVLERQLNPAQGVACYREANRLVQQGAVDEALDLYRQALNATGYSMAAVYFRIGQALEKKGLDEDAETNYHYAAERSDRFVDAFDALGGLNLKRNRHEDAARYFKQGTKISPLNAKRQLKLGEALFEIGDFTGAETAYKRSLELDPVQKTHVYNRLGITMRRLGNLEEAKRYYIKALEIAGDEANLHYNLAQVYMDLHQKGMASTHVEKSLSIKPDFDDALSLKRRISEER